MKVAINDFLIECKLVLALCANGLSRAPTPTALPECFTFILTLCGKKCARHKSKFWQKQQACLKLTAIKGHWIFFVVQGGFSFLKRRVLMVRKARK